MEEISLLVAFGAGLLSFLSPCVLPLVPVYLANLAGTEIFNADVPRRRMPLFLHSLGFVLGFSLIFTILGAGAGLAGFAIGAHLVAIRKVAGVLLIVFGLFMLAALKVSWLRFRKRLMPFRNMTRGYLRSFLTGGIFSLVWTPCVGPILGGILSFALTSEMAWRGAALLAVYSLGLGLPFLLMGVAFDSITPLLKYIRRYSDTIVIVGGLLLITIGILILIDKLVWF